MFDRFTVTHQGVPLGSTYLTSGELGVGELETQAGYSSVRDLIRQASQSLWSVGFLASDDVEVSAFRPQLGAVARVAELPLELRDENGALVPTDFVNVVERPDPDLPPVVFARFRLAGAGEPATPHPMPRDDKSKSG